MAEENTTTVDIDLPDLLELIKKADAHDELVAQHRITPDDVRYVQDMIAFDHSKFTVESSDNQQDLDDGE